PKQKRRFSWTPARLAAFEKCRAAREAQLAAKRKMGKANTPQKKPPSSHDLELAREQARRVMEAIRRHEKEESSDDDADEKHAEPLQNKTEHVKQQMRDPDLTQAQLKLLMAKLDQLEAMHKESRAAPAAA